MCRRGFVRNIERGLDAPVAFRVTAGCCPLGAETYLVLTTMVPPTDGSARER
jgi:hypothetical protein